MPIRRALNRTNAVLLLLVIGLTAWHFKNVVLPMHEIHSIEVLTPEVPQGGTLIIKPEISRRELCDPAVFRFFHRLPDRELVYATRTPGAAGGIGLRQTVRIPIQLPEDLIPGEYEGSGFVANHCSGGEVRNVASPVYRFRVVPR